MYSMHDSILNYIHQIFKRTSYITFIVYLIIVFNFLIYFFILIFSYQNFCSFNAGDQGIMYQLYYNTIFHGNFFFSSVIGGYGIDWGNRYILLLFLPIMYFFQNIPVTFSIISTAIISLGSLPVYWLTRDLLKSERIGLVFTILYFIYPSIGWLMLESVKEEIFVLPFLLFAFYYMHVKSYPMYLVFLFLALICKHNILLVVPMFGFYAYLEKFDLKWIFGPILMSLGWALTLFLILKPFFSPIPNMSPMVSDFTAGRYQWLGSTPFNMFINAITNPQIVVDHLVNIQNIEYIMLLFIPLMGISLLKPKILLIGLPIFLQNLLSTSDEMRMITYHYVSVLVFVIFSSAIFAFPLVYSRLKEQYKIIFIIMLLISSVTTNIAYGPILNISENMHFHNFDYFHSKIQYSTLGIEPANSDIFQSIINEIPNNATLIADPRFGPYIFKNMRFMYYEWSVTPSSFDYVLLPTHIQTDSNFDLFLNKNFSTIDVKYHDGKYVILKFGDFRLDNKNRKTYYELFGWYSKNKEDTFEKWMSQNGSILIYSDQDGKSVEMTFNALSFYKQRTMAIYINNNLTMEKNISNTDYVKVMINLPLNKGSNIIQFHAIGGPERPSNVPELMNPDSRLLSFLIRNIQIMEINN